MAAEITREVLPSRPRSALGLEPLRLTGAVASRRGARARLATRPGRPRAGTTHAVVACTLAVLALAGCVGAVLMLATEPVAARLEHEVASLDRRLGTAHGQLVALQTAVGRSIAREPRLSNDLTRLGRRVTGLVRTVHGLQSSTSLTGEQAAGLRDCVPQVQRELAGLTLTTRAVHGRVTSVGLSDPTLLSPSCASLFAGL